MKIQNPFDKSSVASLRHQIFSGSDLTDSSMPSKIVVGDPPLVNHT